MIIWGILFVCWIAVTVLFAYDCYDRYGFWYWKDKRERKKRR